MKLICQQLFSWTGQYEIYDEQENTLFVVEGDLSDLWPTLTIYDASRKKLGTIERALAFWTNKYELNIGGECVGTITGGHSLVGYLYDVDYNGWFVEGDMMGWEYQIIDPDNNIVAKIDKDIFTLSDMYTVDIKKSEDILGILMVVLAVDLDRAKG